MERDDRSVGVAGQDLSGFLHGLAAIAFGAELQGDFALAAGGDLSRKRDRCAPSAGFDFLYVQDRVTAVFENEAVHDHGTLQNRFKGVTGLGEKRIRLTAGRLRGRRARLQRRVCLIGLFSRGISRKGPDPQHGNQHNNPTSHSQVTSTLASNET